jgi:hypothetical protein
MAEQRSISATWYATVVICRASSYSRSANATMKLRAASAIAVSPVLPHR